MRYKVILIALAVLLVLPVSVTWGGSIYFRVNSYAYDTSHSSYLSDPLLYTIGWDTVSSDDHTSEATVVELSHDGEYAYRINKYHKYYRRWVNGHLEKYTDSFFISPSGEWEYFENRRYIDIQCVTDSIAMYVDTVQTFRREGR